MKYAIASALVLCYTFFEVMTVSKDRLAAFMDAVLAIIITILVLELPKPDPVTLENVLALRESYICYALSFFWLGSLWVGLHNEWHHIQIINKKVVWLGVLMLFVTSWIPYALSVVIKDPMNELAQLLYGGSVMLVILANLLLSAALYKCHVDIEELDSDEHAWIVEMTYIPEILIVAIGMILSALVYPPMMSVSVFIAMLWTHLPFHKIYHEKIK